jgi:hypothetical protein
MFLNTLRRGFVASLSGNAATASKILSLAQAM